MTDSGGQWWRETAVAVGVWLVGTLVVFDLPHHLGRNPASIEGHALALAGLFVGLAVVVACGAALRRRRALVSAVLVGVVATWLVFVQRAALYGTPFTFGLLDGDSGRLTGMATYYSQTWSSSDVFNVGAPNQYPPLFPWLVGRLSDLTGRDAWRLMAPVSVVLFSGSVVVSFALWRRMTSGPVAAMISIAVLAGYTSTGKSFVVLAVAIFIPLALLVVGDAEAGRLHWAAAGLLAGVVVLLYYGVIVFAAPSLAALIFIRMRSSSSRRHEVAYLLKVSATAFVVASWYVMPVVWAALTTGESEQDQSLITAGLIDPLPPFRAVSPLTALQFVGFCGVLALWRKRWWSASLAPFVGGLVVFWGVAQVGLAATGNTLLLQYVPRVLGPVLAASGVLVCHEVVQLASGRFPADELRRGVLVVAASLSIWLLVPIGWLVMPSLDWNKENNATLAHLAAAPDGRSSAFAPAELATNGFPLRRISAMVRAGARPIVLSATQALHVFLPWPSYLQLEPGMSSSSSREAEIVRLAHTLDPTAFAELSASLQHGSIDVFVLRDEGEQWMWRDVAFVPRQFGTDEFVLSHDAPSGLVIAVRTSLSAGDS